MAPDDVAARVGLRRRDDLRPADLLVPFGRQICNDQVSFIGEKEKAVVVRCDERGAEKSFLAVEVFERLP